MASERPMSGNDGSVVSLPSACSAVGRDINGGPGGTFCGTETAGSSEIKQLNIGGNLHLGHQGDICDSVNDSAYHTNSGNSICASCRQKFKPSTSSSVSDSESKRSTDLDKSLSQELSKENASLRARLKGVNILSTLLREAREEIANLNTQKNKMEIAVENLQSRLHRLGANTSVDLAEHEIFMPGHDKQFLNSLITENMRLQKALKSGSGAKDPSAVARDEQLAERIKKLEKTIRYVSEQRTEKERSLQELQDSLNTSGAEKDQEIAALREKVTSLTKARENAETICESLSQEAESLRDQVKAASKASEDGAASQYQMTLDERKKESEKIEQELKKMKQAASNLKPEEQVRILEQQIDQLQKENFRLTDQLKEVIGMNTRWQRYNDQREAYVVKLSKTSYQQQSKITVLERRCSDLIKEITETKKINDVLRRQEENTRDVALFSADQQLAQKDEEIEELTRELKQMRDTVQELSPGNRGDITDKEKIQMLQHQVTQFANDFKEERRDREHMQTKYTDSLKALEDNKRLIKELREQLYPGGSAFTTQSHAFQPLYRQTSCRQELIARGGPQKSFYGHDMTDLPTDVEIDGGHDEPDGAARVPRDDDYVGVGNAEMRDGGEEDDPLQCPHCFRGFSVAEVEKFMQHTNSCLGS